MKPAVLVLVHLRDLQDLQGGLNTTFEKLRALHAEAMAFQGDVVTVDYGWHGEPIAPSHPLAREMWNRGSRRFVACGHPPQLARAAAGIAKAHPGATFTVSGMYAESHRRGCATYLASQLRKLVGYRRVTVSVTAIPFPVDQQEAA